MTDITSSERILGTLRAEDGAATLRLEDRFDTDLADLWSALTDPERLARWYGRVSGDLRLGGEYQIHVEAAGLDGEGRIETCEPPHHLRVLTRETDESRARGDHPEDIGDESPYGSIEVWLTADGDASRLVLETTGLPVDQVQFFGVGWQIHLETLAAYLTDAAPADHEGRWAALLGPYEQLAADVRTGR